MNSRRAGLAALVGAALLAVLVEPVAAQSYDTTTEALIRDLNSLLLYVAVPIAVLVEGILIYTVWKYRKNDEPEPTKENRRLEIAWTVATAVILVAVGVGAYVVMANPYVTAASEQTLQEEQEPLEVRAEAQQFGWTFVYPNETVREVTGEDQRVVVSGATGSMTLPTDRPVEINVTSRDVIHAFHAPGLGLKQDAMPGQYQAILTKPTSTGEYQLYCAEYCGAGHSGMLATIEVTEEEEFADWMNEQVES